MERILFNYVCPECKMVNAQVESVENDGRGGPILPVVVFDCEKCKCSYQVQYQMEDEHDDDPRAMEETEAILKPGRKNNVASRLTDKEDEGRGGMVTNIVRSKDTYVLVNAFDDFEYMDRTGILKTPSTGRSIADEYKKIIGNTINFTSIKCDIASELVRRYISTLTDVKTRLKCIDEIITDRSDD